MEVSRRLPFLARSLPTHHLWFTLFLVVSLVPFWKPLNTLVSLSLQDDKYSHILLIPPIAVGMVYLRRRIIFASPRFGVFLATPLVSLGMIMFWLAQSPAHPYFSTPNPSDRLSLMVLAIVLVWLTGFVLCYGAHALRASLFQCLFLFLMIPIPTVALDKAVLFLQQGSAVMTYALFKVLGVPVLWQGFKFSLPGVEIEIAKECSGIRSSLSLLITSLLAGHIFLQSNWRRLAFSLFTVPVVIFKNAVRIVTISSLGVYVDAGFLHGRLHRYGGFMFSLISVAILLPLLLALQTRETDSVEPENSKRGQERQIPPLQTIA